MKEKKQDNPDVVSKEHIDFIKSFDYDADRNAAFLSKYLEQQKTQPKQFHYKKRTAIMKIAMRFFNTRYIARCTRGLGKHDLQLDSVSPD